MSYLGNQTGGSTGGGGGGNTISLPLSIASGGTSATNAINAKTALGIISSPNDGTIVESGTTAQRGNVSQHKIRFNIDTSKYEGSTGSAWTAFGGGGPLNDGYLTSASTSPTSSLNHNAVPSLNLKEGTAYAVSQVLAYSSNIAWNTNLGQIASVTLIGSSATVLAPTQLVNGAFYSLEVIQDGTGGRLLIWNNAFKFANNTAPTLTTLGNARDFFTFKSDGIKLYEQGRSQGIIA